MGKEKKKSDWDNLSEMLSQDADAPQIVDEWNADEPSTAPAVEAEAEKSVAKTSAAKTKRVCGEKKAKATNARKKAAPKTDKIDAALAGSVVDAPQNAETVDLTVAETEKAPKKRRRTTKKVEQDETELVKNVLKLESETKAKKRARAKAAEAETFAGLLSQINRVAQEAPETETEIAVETTETEAEIAVETPETEAEIAAETPETEAEIAVEATEENVDSNDFFGADFFADSNVEELEISWGRPRADESETVVAETVDAPETEAETETVAEETVDAPVESDVEEAAPRRRERRRRRRDDRAPREETNVAETVSAVDEDVKTDFDLNDLDAFFATDSEDEGVGFAPRRESKKAEKVVREEKTERVEKARPVETPERPTFDDDAFDADEDDETRSKRKRRRRRNGRERTRNRRRNGSRAGNFRSGTRASRPPPSRPSSASRTRKRRRNGRKRRRRNDRRTPRRRAGTRFAELERRDFARRSLQHEPPRQPSPLIAFSTFETLTRFRTPFLRKRRFFIDAPRRRVAKFPPFPPFFHFVRRSKRLFLFSGLQRRRAKSGRRRKNRRRAKKFSEKTSNAVKKRALGAPELPKEIKKKEPRRSERGSVVRKTSAKGKIFAFLQKLLNPFPQIYDKPFSADVGTLLHDGATIPRSTSGSRVVVASTVESAAFSVSFADFSFRAYCFAT